MDMIEYAHYEFIEDALYEGKQVPREILEKYSDLDASWLKKRPSDSPHNSISRVAEGKVGPPGEDAQRADW